MIRVSFSKDFLVCIASGLFIGALFFDIFPEVNQQLGLQNTLIFIAIGFGLWLLLKTLTDFFSKSSLAIVSSLAFWFHSFLEGAVTALSFSVNFATGIVVALGMFFHLLPEFFAIVSLLRGEGVSFKKSVLVDLGGIVTLLISFFVIYSFLGFFSENLLRSMGAISGGSFLYIGLVSFIKRSKNPLNYLGLFLGLIIIALCYSLYIGAFTSIKYEDMIEGYNYAVQQIKSLI